MSKIRGCITSPLSILIVLVGLIIIVALLAKAVEPDGAYNNKTQLQLVSYGQKCISTFGGTNYSTCNTYLDTFVTCGLAATDDTTYKNCQHEFITNYCALKYLGIPANASDTDCFKG